MKNDKNLLPKCDVFTQYTVYRNPKIQSAVCSPCLFVTMTRHFVIYGLNIWRSVLSNIQSPAVMLDYVCSGAVYTVDVSLPCYVYCSCHCEWGEGKALPVIVPYLQQMLKPILFPLLSFFHLIILSLPPSVSPSLPLSLVSVYNHPYLTLLTPEAWRPWMCCHDNNLMNCTKLLSHRRSGSNHRNTISQG